MVALVVSSLALVAGIKLVFSRQISITQPSYLSECQAAKDAGAEILFPSIDASGMSRIERSCSTVGYHPTPRRGYRDERDCPLNATRIALHEPWRKS